MNFSEPNPLVPVHVYLNNKCIEYSIDVEPSQLSGSSGGELFFIS